MGDAVLIADGSYHWSYGRRLARARTSAGFIRFGEELRTGYVSALESRLHDPSAADASSAIEDARALLRMHERVFRFVEELRLRRGIPDWRVYAEGSVEYPRALAPSALKRLNRLVRSFGPPGFAGFYRRHLGRPAEEVLLRAFPRLAYGTDVSSLGNALNWSPAQPPTPIAIWERFHRAWMSAG